MRAVEILTSENRAIAFFLSAPAKLYEGLVRLREMAYGRGSLDTVRVPVPVFCVGNLTVGGTGKTPGVIWLVQYLKEKGRHPAILTRGYKREPVARGKDYVGVGDVQNVSEKIRQVGDEPLLLSKRLPGVPILAGADRSFTAQIAIEKYGADCLVLDDGYQHFRLYRDVNLLCIDAFGDGPLLLSRNIRLLPAGRFREPLSGLKRAQVVFLTKFNLLTPQAGSELLEFFRREAPDTPVVPVRYELKIFDPASGRDVQFDELKAAPVLAVSGLAAPESFEMGLRQLNLEVEGLRFPDHHHFTDADRETILKKAGDRKIIVTEKDHQRLPKGFPCLVARLEWVPEGYSKEGQVPEWLKKIDSAIS